MISAADRSSRALVAFGLQSADYYGRIASRAVYAPFHDRLIAWMDFWVEDTIPAGVSSISSLWSSNQGSAFISSLSTFHLTHRLRIKLACYCQYHAIPPHVGMLYAVHTGSLRNFEAVTHLHRQFVDVYLGSTRPIDCRISDGTWFTFDFSRRRWVNLDGKIR